MIKFEGEMTKVQIIEKLRQSLADADAGRGVPARKAIKNLGRKKSVSVPRPVRR